MEPYGFLWIHMDSLFVNTKYPTLMFRDRRCYWSKPPSILQGREYIQILNQQNLSPTSVTNGGGFLNRYWMDGALIISIQCFQQVRSVVWLTIAMPHMIFVTYFVPALWLQAQIGLLFCQNSNRVTRAKVLMSIISNSLFNLIHLNWLTTANYTNTIIVAWE